MESARLLERYLRVESDDIEARKLLCRIYSNMEDYTKLLLHSALLAQHAPDDEDALRWRELAREEVDRAFPEKKQRYERVLELTPGDYETRLKLISLLEQQDEYEQAQEHFDIIMEQQPDMPEIMLRYARFLVSTDRPQKAERYYLKYLDEHPDPLIEREKEDVLLRQGSRFFETEQYDKAKEHFEWLISSYPENLDFRLQYARLLSWHEFFDESLEAYREYLERVDDPELIENAKLAQIRVLAWNQRFGMAAHELREFIEEYPDNLDAQVLLADLYRWNDDTQMAGEYYQKVLEKDPEHRLALEGMENLQELTRKRIYGAERLSIDAMERRVEEDPENLTDRRQLARLYSAEGRYRDAVRQYEVYLDMKPDDYPVIRDYAAALGFMGRYQEAIHYYHQYLEQHPSDISALMRVANFLIWAEHYDEAVSQLREIAGLDPDNKEMHWRLAHIFRLHEMWDEALYHYEILLEIAPEIVSAQHRIRQIKNHPRYKLQQLERKVENEPESLELRIRLAQKYLDMRRFYEAYEHAEIALNIAPRNRQAMFILQRGDEGIERVRMQRIETLQDKLDENPDDTQSRLELAQLLMVIEELHQARPHFELYLEHKPEDLDARLQYARLLSWLDGYAREAVRQLDMLIEINPDDVELRLQRLEITKQLMAAAENDEEEDEDSNNRRQLPRPNRPRQNPAQDEDDGEDFIMSDDDFEDEWEYIESELHNRVDEDPENTDIYVLLGRVYHLQELWEYAEFYYKKALDLDPDHEEAENRLELLLASPMYRIHLHKEKINERPYDIGLRLQLAEMYLDNELYYDALGSAEVVLAMDEDNARALQIHRYCEGVTERLRKEEIEKIRAHLAKNPRDFDKHLELGRLFQAEGDLDNALWRFEFYLDQHPDDDVVRHEYANLLAQFDESRFDAIAEIRDLLAYYPHDYELRMDYIRIMTWQRDFWWEAERELKDMRRLNPKDYQAMLFLAHLYRYMGRYKESREIYEDIISEFSTLKFRERLSRRSLLGRRPIPSVFSPDSGRRLTLPEEGAPEPHRDELQEREQREEFAFVADDAEFDQGIILHARDAHDGLESIDNELKPQVRGIIGGMSDNEGYSQFQAGLHYYHFLKSGTRLNIGLTAYRFKDSDELEDRTGALMLSGGVFGRIENRITGAAGVNLTQYDIHSNPSLSGNARVNYELTGLDTLSLEYTHLDAVFAANTGSALEEKISFDRFRLEWAGQPPQAASRRPFTERFFFNGHVSYGFYSDGPRQTALNIQPAYRFRESPSIDLKGGYRGLYYSSESDHYWSPNAHEGPFVGTEIGGNITEKLTYTFDVELSFPKGSTSRLIALSLQRPFGNEENISVGLNMYYSMTPREDGSYRSSGIMLDATLFF